jgi:RNA polymerase sigma-70 factor, ECF subfamily
MMSAGALTPPPDPQAEDEALELVARCKGGDGAAWRALYVAHFAYVSRLARNLGTPPAEIEDVIQEVFTVAFRKLGDFTHGQLTTWLYRITANVVTDHHRKRRVRAAFASVFGPRSEEVAPQLGADRQLEQAQARAQVGRILEKMSPKKREVFVLFEIEGLPGEAIAERVGCPVETVWTRLFHARKEFARLGARAQVLEGAGA